MIDHLQSHTIGGLHVLAALSALLFGTAIIFARKGTISHRWLGRAYVLSMLALNLSALAIFELFGHFGPFHWMALISLASVFAGYLPVRKRGLGWRQGHAYAMTGSYVGLVAATVAEVASRVPGWSFALSVVISSVVVIVVGLVLMQRLLPGILRGDAR